ncbi:MAG: MBL fold metallo-hydrolase [Acidimicrobiia bacterium]|nr:MBL fold metallo-hydrolase [Acidimicrobiia bacterium]
MTPDRAITRRTAIKDMGKAGLAIVVFGAACTSEGSPTTLGQTTTTSLGPTTTTGAATSSTTTPPGATGSDWARVNLGFVSAYLLYRGGEVALVDTGQAGAESDIEKALSTIGLGWDAVSNVILTHRHPDHVGSVVAVAAAAPDALVHIGAGDADAVGNLPNGPVIVNDGDRVFDLTIIETPGHTVGHISVLDGPAAILVAGDAVNTNGGTLNGSDPAFTADPDAARATIAKLAGFDFEVILPGHGEPVLSGGSVEMSSLAASLGG